MRIEFPTRSNLRQRRKAAAVVLAFSSLLLAPMALVAQVSEPFADEVLVQEMSVVVDFDDALSSRQTDNLRPEDLQLLEDGLMRTVTRIQEIDREPIPSGTPVYENVGVCPWNFTVYLDSALSRPETIRNAALALGQKADWLTELGCVDIVDAAPVPNVLIQSSRSREFVSKVLSDRAEQSRNEIERSGRTDVGQPEQKKYGSVPVQEQWDRLIAFISDHDVSGPKVLFLVTDGFVIPRLDMEILSGRAAPMDPGSRERSAADVVVDTAQMLASYGWLTVPMPRVGTRGQTYDPQPRDFDSFRDESEGRFDSGERRTVINFFGTSRPGRPSGGLDDRLFEAYMLPSLAPLRAVAEATAGELVWNSRQLDGLLDKLDKKRLLWFQSSEPHDGRIRRLEVRLTKNDLHLTAPWWKRSSTPHLVSEARLRSLANGEEILGRLEVSASWEQVAGNTQAVARLMRLRVAPFETSRGESIGHIRISVGMEGADRNLTFLHQTDYKAPPLGGEWEYALAFQAPEDSRRVFVSVDDLVLEEWGATTIEERGNGEGRQ